MSQVKYVQYGCGWSAPDNWRNFDASPTLRFERLPLIGQLYTKNATRFPANVEYGDIVKGLPIKLESCKGVYCSHVLEHLSLDGFRAALHNTKKLLQRGGVFRFVLPDLEYSVRRYLDSSLPDASVTFLKETGLGQEVRVNSIKGYVASLFGNSQHLWMWDFKAIELELKNAGFIEIRRAYFGDSSDLRFNEVEEMVRWDNCLGLECKKS